MTIHRMWRIIAISFFILLSACGRSDSSVLNSSSIGEQSTNQTEQTTPTQATADQASTVGVHKSYVITIHSLADRVAQSDVIVIGEIAGIGKMFNAARDPEDDTKPATDRFGIGQEYQVRVKQYLKGNGSSNLIVVQGEGTVRLPPEAVTAQDIMQARSLDDSPPFQQGASYLLFLDHTTIFDGQDYYAGFDEPWRYLITTDGQTIVETPEEIKSQLATDLLSAETPVLLSKVEQLVTAERAANPTP